MEPENKWYFSREEINHSPSRKDGISFIEESRLRQRYCSYIKEIGIELHLPQKTIASAMLLCHRFYMRQSHLKNSWQTMASSCLFLASKSEDTPRFLRKIVVLSYKLQHEWDHLAEQRIRDDWEVFDKHKKTVLLGENLLLVTLGFDLEVDLPYVHLVSAVKDLGVLSGTDLVRVSWNYVNDWLWTTLCLRFRPNYIAAGSLYLAAKRVKIELPVGWWMKFVRVYPKPLASVIQRMLRLDEQIEKRAVGFMTSPESCSSAAHEGASPVDEIKEGKLEEPEEIKPDEAVEALIERDELESGHSEENALKGVCLDVDGIMDRAEIKPSALEIRDGGLDKVLIEGDELESGQSEEKTSGERVKKRKLEKASENKPAALETLEIRGDGFEEAYIGESEENALERARMDNNQTNLDIDGIRERMKKRKLEKASAIKSSSLESPEIRDDDLQEAWIERELESVEEM